MFYKHRFISSFFQQVAVDQASADCVLCFFLSVQFYWLGTWLWYCLWLQSWVVVRGTYYYWQITCTVHYSRSVTVQADCPVCPALAFSCNFQTFRHRGRGKRKRGRDTDVRKKHWLPLVCTPTKWDWSYNLSLCPDRESNQYLFGTWEDVQPAEPQWPGPCTLLSNNLSDTSGPAHIPFLKMFAESQGFFPMCVASTCVVHAHLHLSYLARCLTPTTSWALHPVPSPLLGMSLITR